MSLDLQKLRTLNGGRVGVTDAACPLCGPDCRTSSNRKRGVLRIWDDGAFVTFKCARCEASGWAKEEGGNFAVNPKPRPKILQAESDRTTSLAQFLWLRSTPLRGSLAETYLRSRSCLVESESLRCLPANLNHPPAMIARFGFGPITGIHITKLKEDGSGKAGTDCDKIMLGKSVGQPIIVHENLDRGELLIAEGIEDAASLALCTGWTAWAAGAAGRIPSVLATASGFERIFISVDHDRAGMIALTRSLSVRRDIIPLKISKTLAGNADANKALIEYGPDALLASIEWSEGQASYRRGEIGFHAMQAQIARADGVFRTLAGDGVLAP